MGYRFIPHPEAERFDQVILRTEERWKESELSGDEWRFSYIADFYSHGVHVGSINGRSIEDLLVRAAAGYNSLKDDTSGGYYGDLENICCQPGCKSKWVHLLHPIRRYSRTGQELVRSYANDEVRGFCEKHKHRGDCGLDDNDDNYVAVAYREESGGMLPPEASIGKRE